MTVEELLVYAKQYIHSDHAKILLAELINKNVLELYNYLDYQVSAENIEKYKKEVEALKEGKPLQYVLGYVNFYGNIFKINNNVLIPRFETEELVENIINYSKKFFTEPVDIIDLGCGSGVIGLSLAKKIPTKTVDLVDISEEALKITEINRDNLNINARLIQSDMWKNINDKYDIIVSNPPYIKTNEKIEDVVKNNEPHLALYAGEDGLDCYRKILKDIEPHMKDKCLVGFEIGMTQAEKIKEIALSTLDNIKVEIKKDLSGKDRMLFIFKNLNN